MDCSCEKSDTDCAADSEWLAFGCVIGSDSSECTAWEYTELHNLNSFGFDSVAED